MLFTVPKFLHWEGRLSFFGVSVDNSAANLFRSFVRLVSRVLFSFFKSSIFPSVIPPASVLDGLPTKCFQVRMSPLKIPQYWFRLVQLLHQCEYPVSEGPKCIILNGNFLCLPCPSATFAFQYGGFVPSDWRAARAY